MPNLNDFIDPDLTADDVLHSTGYASAAGGGGAGGLSMDRRQQLRNEPRVVGSYQYSELGRRGAAIKARTADQKRGRAYDASSETFSDNARFGNRQRGNVASEKLDTSINKRQHFIEPSSRPKPGGYNPFG